MAASLIDHLVPELKANMDESGVSLNLLSERTGIPRTSLQRKMLDPNQFTLGELAAIASVCYSTNIDSLLVRVMRGAA